MADPRYTLEADEPIWKQVPWWAWAIGLGVLFVILTGKKRDQRDFEEYLR